MSNGEANCILEVCCPPDSPQAREAFAEKLAHDTGLSREYADVCATFVYANFDLAERGTLVDLKASIVKVYNAQHK